MNYFKSRKITYIAMFIVLNIVLTRIGSIRIGFGGVEFGRFGFGGFPTIFASIAMGPVAGGIVGAVGDLIGYWINPMGAYMPHFTLTAALDGIIPALVLRIFKTKQPAFWQLFLAIATTQIITSIILVPYFLYKLFGVPLVYKIPSAIIGQAFHIPIYTAFARILLKRVNFNPVLSKN
ncbi:folate family ECF transporter S component [Thermosediminibacter oceani]|uniref:Signal transduction histidine kinase, LytS n=1 Tax=Thermosediminibacter oceani (strain ATCC BAA-1034 / DSM 16646 / JW/IW-1228P) TaxID=555079 RepID=D9S2C4_THEOJ|nr:folate family ECF transporter S component [Thermosediminibacter oceani]ADL07551.1 conserved hypothetical protein [Thermosediminibacter oceani DSM 16646]